MKKLALFVLDVLAVLVGLILAAIAIALVWIFLAIMIPTVLVLIAVAGVAFACWLVCGLNGAAR